MLFYETIIANRTPSRQTVYIDMSIGTSGLADAFFDDLDFDERVFDELGSDLFGLASQARMRLTASRWK